MKINLNLIWRLAIALVLIIGLTMAMAPPVAAQDDNASVESAAARVNSLCIVSPDSNCPVTVKPGVTGADCFKVVFTASAGGQGIFGVSLGNYLIYVSDLINFDTLPQCQAEVWVTVPACIPGTTEQFPDGIYDLMVGATTPPYQSLFAYDINPAAVIVDRDAPTICFNTPVEGSYLRDCVNVEVQTFDVGTGVKTVIFEYSANGVIWCQFGLVDKPALPKVCVTLDTKGIADGQYQLRATAIDYSGNRCNTSALHVTVDNTPPTLPAITNPKGGERWLNEETYNIAWNTPVDTNFKGVFIDLLNKDGTVNMNIASDLPAAGPYAWEIDGVVAGDYQIKVTARDLAGNCSWAVSNCFSIYSLDNSRPEVDLEVSPFTPITGKDWIKGKIDLSADADDEGSGIAYVEFLYSITNGTPWIEIGKDYTEPYGMPFDTTCLANGAKVEIQAIAYNTTGAWTSDTLTFFVDNSAPAVCLVSPQSGFYPDGLTITASAFDEQTGITCVEFYYSTDTPDCLNKTWTLIGYGTYDAVKCVYTAPWTGMSEGTYLLQAKAFNGIGLACSSDIVKDKTTGIVIDKTPPAGLALIAPNGGELIKIGSDFDIKWVPATDAHLADCPIKIELLRGASLTVVGLITANHSNSGCFTWENISNIIPGNDYKVRITAADKAGNCFAVCSANYFTIAADWDDTAPTVTLTCPGNNAAVSSNYVVKADAADPDTGIQMVVFEYSLDGGAVWEEIGTAYYAPFSVTWDTTGINDSKNVMVRAKAYNGVGVFSISTSIGICIDNSCHGVPTVRINPVFCPTNCFPIITGVAADNWCGIGQVKVAVKNYDTSKYWDGSACWVDHIVWLDAVGCESWAFDARCIPFATDTNYEVFAKAYDKAGNASAEDMVCFICKTDKLILKPGWNFISVPQKLTCDYDTFGKLMAGFDKCKAFAISYDCDGRMVWLPLCADSPVEVLCGYWVMVPPECYPEGICLKVRYDSNTTSLAAKYLVGESWNTIGPSGNCFGEEFQVVEELISITTNIMPTLGSWSTLVSWNAEFQCYEEAILITDIINVINPPMMETGKGYWIFITNPAGDTLCEITTY